MSELYKVLRIIYIRITTLYYCIRSGIEYDSSYQIKGCPKVNKGNFLKRLLKYPAIGGELIIGKDFKCNNKMKSNSIGLIQPCLFNILTKGSKIIIGNNVGISGSTLSAIQSITIGNNVLIGSGCLITDSDAHPIDWKDRLYDKDEMIKIAPIIIKDNVFIGARSGECSVVGAGSVVTRDIPPYSLVGGNPAKIIKSLKDE